MEGGNGRSRSDKLYRNLVKYIEKAKSEDEDLMVSSSDLCGDAYFGTRTRKFITYVCKEKFNIPAFNSQFKISEINPRKYLSFKIIVRQPFISKLLNH